VAEPTEQDVLILNNIIENVANLTSGRLSDAPECLKGIIKSNKYERSGIIEILGFSGILRVPDYPNYLKEYTPVHRRRHSSYSKSDWSFPADIWLPEYGVDVEAIQFWFGEYLR